MVTPEIIAHLGVRLRILRNERLLGAGRTFLGLLLPKVRSLRFLRRGTDPPSSGGGKGSLVRLPGISKAPVMSRTFARFRTSLLPNRR
jgi:hypothetical protein